MEAAALEFSGDDPHGRIIAPSVARRLDKRRVTTLGARFGVNPLVRALFRLGIPAPGTAILETVGRRSGQLRRTPVTNGLDGDTFWIVAEHGRNAGYVRNIEANPRVRVRAGRRWREGRAQIVPEDDPHARLARIARGASRLNAGMVRLVGTELLTVRIDLDR